MLKLGEMNSSSLKYYNIFVSKLQMHGVFEFHFSIIQVLNVYIVEL